MIFQEVKVKEKLTAILQIVNQNGVLKMQHLKKRYKKLCKHHFKKKKGEKLLKKKRKHTKSSKYKRWLKEIIHRPPKFN